MSATLYGPEFFLGRGEFVKASAAVVVPIVEALLAPESVLDVGCGKGEWLDALSISDKAGVDIAAPERFGFLTWDLTTPFMLYRDFDLVVCLEVGEHLPEESADTLIDTLVRHGGDILFSAAVPGQEGIGHINCQPHEYWHAKFEARGYEMRDAVRPLIEGDHRVSPWYRNNIFLYLEPS